MANPILGVLLFLAICITITSLVVAGFFWTLKQGHENEEDVSNS